MDRKEDRISLGILGRYAGLKKLDKYEKELLAGWEEIYKKGQLTFWILLALIHGPKHMAQIKRFIDAYTNGTLVADDKSMYRALRRYYDAELVNFRLKTGKSGPELKMYFLSETGQKVLDNFVQRNIIGVFFNPKIKAILEGSKQ